MSAALYSVFVALVSVLMVRRPAAALIVAMNMFPLKQWAGATSPFFEGRPVLTNLIAGSLVLAGVVMQSIRGRVGWPFYPATAWLIAALLLYALATVAWSPDCDTCIRVWKDALPYILTVIFLAPLTIQDKEDLHVVFSGMLVSGTILAALLLFTVRWEGRLIVSGQASPGGPLGGNPLVVGSLGGTLIILSVLYRFRSGQPALQILKLPALLAGLALAARSGSRGQLVGAVVAAGLFRLLSRPQGKPLKGVSALFVIAVLVVLARIGVDVFWAGSGRFDAAVMQGDFTGRLQSGLTLLHHAMGSPFSLLFGLGNSSSYRILGIYPHIVPLEVLGEEGIVGFLLLGALVVGTVATAMGSLRAIGANPEMRGLFACVAGLWCYQFLLINKQGSLLQAYDFFFYTILVAGFGQFARGGKRGGGAPGARRAGSPCRPR